MSDRERERERREGGWGGVEAYTGFQYASNTLHSPETLNTCCVKDCGSSPLYKIGDSQNQEGDRSAAAGPLVTQPNERGDARVGKGKRSGFI